MNAITDFHHTLFSDQQQPVYAVLDGASFVELVSDLKRLRADYRCLYRGELAEDMASVAPYLVALTSGSELTLWVLNHIGQNFPGIFAQTTVSMDELRKHLRTFLMIKDADNNPLYFRYYDPRVLRSYIPSCTVEEKKTLFGPVSQYFAENREGSQLLRFSQND